MIVAVTIEDERWNAIDLKAEAVRAGRAVAAHLNIDPGNFEVSLLGCDDARIAALNHDFRQNGKPTNVLSWPSVDRGTQTIGMHPDPPKVIEDRPVELGDVAISFQTCKREADAANLTLSEHTQHLLVHSVLHLLGYDHENDPDAAIMETTEAEILAAMGIADPYIQTGP